MSEQTTKGVGTHNTHKQKFSTPVLSASAANRKRNRELKQNAKQKRMEETGDGNRVRSNSGVGSKVKSQAGRGKNPMVLECKSMSATGLKAGGAGYVASERSERAVRTPVGATMRHIRIARLR